MLLSRLPSKGSPALARSFQARAENHNSHISRARKRASILIGKNVFLHSNFRKPTLHSRLEVIENDCCFLIGPVVHHVLEIVCSGTYTLSENVSSAPSYK